MQEALDRLPTVVMGAVRRLLRPLVRLMIRHGITLPSIVELLKQVMVEVAIKDFPVEGKRTTDSRVSVLTGVHRKDVKRFREQGFQHNDVPKKVSLGMQLVNAWMTEPRWLDEQGRPRVLPRQADGSGRPDFETLSNHISSDVRPRAILDDLLRVGVVEERDNRVALLEVADGLLQPETRRLVENPRFREHVDGVVFAASDAMGAVAGALRLQDQKLPLLAVTGSFTASPLAVQEVVPALEVPVLLKTELSDPQVAGGLLDLLRSGLRGHEATGAV